MAKTKNTDITQSNKDVQKLECSYAAVGSVQLCNCINWQIIIKLNLVTSNSGPRYLLEEIKTYAQTQKCSEQLYL